MNTSDDQTVSLALQKIEVLLQKFGKTLFDYSLSQPTFLFHEENAVFSIVAKETSDEYLFA
jgi:hypothetical protein